MGSVGLRQAGAVVLTHEAELIKDSEDEVEGKEFYEDHRDQRGRAQTVGDKRENCYRREANQECLCFIRISSREKSPDFITGGHEA